MSRMKTQDFLFIIKYLSDIHRRCYINIVIALKTDIVRYKGFHYKNNFNCLKTGRRKIEQVALFVIFLENWFL